MYLTSSANLEIWKHEFLLSDNVNQSQHFLLTYFVKGQIVNIFGFGRPYGLCYNCATLLLQR